MSNTNLKVLTNTGLNRLVTLINEKFAPLASPTLTGVPTAPTPTTGDDSTKIATTAFVQNALSSSDAVVEEYTAAEVDTIWEDYYHPFVTVTITQSDHQTIHVLINNETDHTETFSVRTGAQYNITVTPDTGYVAGIVANPTGTLSEAMTVSATAATVATFTLTLAATENQTITLTYIEPDEEAVTVTSTNEAQEITVNYGTTWTASIEGDTGYAAGTLSPDSSGTITDDITITATAASALE